MSLSRTLTLNYIDGAAAWRAKTERAYRADRLRLRLHRPVCATSPASAPGTLDPVAITGVLPGFSEIISQGHTSGQFVDPATNSSRA